MTQIEKDAWKLSDIIAKTVVYLYKTDLSESVRTKMIRDILKDNLKRFCENQMGLGHSVHHIIDVKESEEKENA